MSFIAKRATLMMPKVFGDLSSMLYFTSLYGSSSGAVSAAQVLETTTINSRSWDSTTSSHSQSRTSQVPVHLARSKRPAKNNPNQQDAR